MADYTLYAHPRSGNSYRVALMLSFTGTPFDFVLVDLMNGGNLAPEFLKINPLGKVPALRHGDLVLRQSHDCLRYLSEQTGQFGPEGWGEEARIGDWIGFAIDFFGYGVARMRFEMKFGAGPGPVYDFFKKTGDRGLGVMEAHLAEHVWLACDRPTIADIACFPASTFLPDAGYDVAKYPNVAAWQDRFRALPGFALQLDLMPHDNWPPK